MLIDIVYACKTKDMAMLDKLGSSHLIIGGYADMWTQSQVSAHPLGNTARETGRRENLGSRLGKTLV